MYNWRNTQETSDDGCLEGGELGVNKNPGKGGKLFLTFEFYAMCTSGLLF